MRKETHFSIPISQRMSSIDMETWGLFFIPELSELVQEVYTEAFFITELMSTILFFIAVQRNLVQKFTELAALDLRSVFYSCTLWTGTHRAISRSEVNICLLQL